MQSQNPDVELELVKVEQYLHKSRKILFIIKMEEDDIHEQYQLQILQKWTKILKKLQVAYKVSAEDRCETKKLYKEFE